MAKFALELPEDVMKDFQKIYNKSEEIFGGMTKKGARYVEKNVKANLPEGLRKSKNFKKCIKLTKTYRTPTDDGINTKIIISGYFRNSNGQKIPAPLVANVFEYGRSNNPFPKQPFFRKSFKKSQLQKIMFEEQKRLSEGILDE